MKVSRIEVVIDPADGPEEAITAVYTGESKRWVVNGPAYPRHLRMLTDIVSAIRDADSFRDERA